MTTNPARRFAALALVLAAGAATVGACSSSPTPAPAASAAAAPAASAAAGGATILAPLPAEITVGQAANLQKAGAFMLDVREPSEWAAGHIDGATLVPLGTLSTALAKVPKDRQVVVVCRSGNRSATGRDILLKAGYPSVTSMAGGMNDWAAAGQPVKTGE